MIGENLDLIFRVIDDWFIQRNATDCMIFARNQIHN